MTIRLRTLLAIALGALVLAVSGTALFAWSGLYDISATSQHTQPVFKLLDYAMRQSVRAHSRELPAPGDLESPRRIAAGAALYRAHCVQCHGAPGVAPDALAFGLMPVPANLLHAGREWPARDIYWVVRHGIKMTGMPAWTYRLTDDEIWDVVAFVRAMPRLAPADYQVLMRALPPTAPQQPAAETVAANPREGDPAAGRQAVQAYLCATCHVIPGFTGAQHHVGPPLSGIGTRAFIAGVLPNTRENMVRFLLDPQRIDPLSAMPDMGVTEQDARDIAAYLGTLDRVAK